MRNHVHSLTSTAKAETEAKEAPKAEGTSGTQAFEQEGPQPSTAATCLHESSPCASNVPINSRESLSDPVDKIQFIISKKPSPAPAPTAAAASPVAAGPRPVPAPREGQHPGCAAGLHSMLDQDAAALGWGRYGTGYIMQKGFAICR